MLTDRLSTRNSSYQKVSSGTPPSGNLAIDELLNWLKSFKPDSKVLANYSLHDHVMGTSHSISGSLDFSYLGNRSSAIAFPSLSIKEVKADGKNGIPANSLVDESVSVAEIIEHLESQLPIARSINAPFGLKECSLVGFLGSVLSDSHEIQDVRMVDGVPLIGYVSSVSAIGENFTDNTWEIILLGVNASK